MKLIFLRPCTVEEQTEELKKHKKYPLTKILNTRECNKITLQIRYCEGLPFIDSIAVNNKWLQIREYENMNFLQVFEE